MGFLDKFMGKVNPDNDNYDEGEYVFDGPDDDVQGNPYGGYDNGYHQPTMQGNVQMNNMGAYPNMAPQYNGAQNQQMTIDSSSLELKVVRPDRSDMVFQIADHLLNGRTVVLNLENCNSESQRRMIDFLTGVAYSIGGDLRKVANKTYVITPNNVDVSADSHAAALGQQGAQNNAGNSAKDLFNDI